MSALDSFRDSSFRQNQSKKALSTGKGHFLFHLSEKVKLCQRLIGLIGGNYYVRWGKIHSNGKSATRRSPFHCNYNRLDLGEDFVCTVCSEVASCRLCCERFSRGSTSITSGRRYLQRFRNHRFHRIFNWNYNCAMFLGHNWSCSIYASPNYDNGRAWTRRRLSTELFESRSTITSFPWYSACRELLRTNYSLIA